MSTFVFVCVYLITFCNCSDVFHVGSKITFYSNYSADFFGYAVAFHESGILIGAPKANATGDVFSCPLQNLNTRKVQCTPMNLKGCRKSLQKDMWFGASLAVGPTGKVLICAPRWSRPFERSDWINTTNSVGACCLRMKRRDIFLIPTSNVDETFYTNYTRKDYSDYNLCNSTNKTSMRLHFATFAQTGMATKFTESTYNFIIGAPGLLVWSGGVIQYKYEPDVNSFRHSPEPTFNSFYVDDVGPDEYFGYSVESGIFEDDGNELYVTGGPKGSHGFGLVLVIQRPTLDMAAPNILAKLEGPQLGAYFGASLCCLDIDGDGRTDLLVGAPNYVKWFDRDALYDQGAVYVYLNKEQANGFTLEYVGHVTGSETNGAKFGSGIAGLGDIDADGFNDVVISAPWENNGVGAIYIYTGGKRGLNSQYVQKIVASKAKGFGMGLTRGHDVDDNNCNDLVVGAHGSGTAYVYRCIPTVKVQVTIKVPEVLSMSQNTTNFTAQFCISVIPLKIYRIAMLLEFLATVTVDPEGNRVKIPGNSTYTLLATPPYDICENKLFELKPAADLSRPIAIMFDVVLIDKMKDNPIHFITNAGRVSTDSTMYSEFDLQLTKDCGEDLICRPWLEMTLEALSEPYIPGAGGRLGATITVLNMEEPAFGIRINLTLPSPPRRIPSTCNLQELNMTCVLPSPLIRNQTAKWEVEFDYTKEMREMGFTVISADIHDAVVGRNVSDHASQYLGITIKPVANISASGKAVPNATLTVTRDKLVNGGYIPFVHYYQVINTGPSDRPDLKAMMHASETCKKIFLASNLTGCVEEQVNASLALLCAWSVTANDSLSIVLPLRFDLATNGESLEAATNCKVTTTLIVSLEYKVITLPVTTTFVLEPVSTFWIAILVGTVIGLLLLAIISYIVFRFGCLSRKRHPDHKKVPGGIVHEKTSSSSLRSSQQSEAANEEHLKPECSSSPQSSRQSRSEEDPSKPGCS